MPIATNFNTENMNNRKSWIACLKWGVVLGAALAVFELIKMAARNVDYAGAKMFDIALIIILILILYAGIKEMKEKFTERLSFAKAFLGTILITAVGSLIFFAYAFVHYTCIDKDGLQKKREASLTNYRELINNDTIKTAELTAFLDTTKSLMVAQESVCTDTLTAELAQEVHKGVMMIDKFYAEKLQAKQKLDTANNYKMGNFLPYARLTLVQTLEIYVTQNADKVSTPFVKSIVENTNQQLPTVNPADLRFERRKSEVPQYDKLSIYVFICTMMNFLYGLFFGLFVALFHYTSKHAAEENTTEIIDEEISSDPLDNNN